MIAAAALASCSGNLGTGSGLSIPQTGGFGQPAAPGQYGTQSRERTEEGAVTMSADTHEIPLPQLDGFAVAIELGTPGPSPSPSVSPDATSSAVGAATRRLLSRLHPTASPSPSPSPSATPSPSPSPSPSSSGKPAGKPSGKGSPTPTPRPKIVTKTTVYPDDAPSVPTPVPTGDVQTFVHRTPIVRGFLQPATDISLYGLGAVRFTIPSEEQTAGRGFTVAIFENGKRHHEKLIAYDPQAQLNDDVVASPVTSPAIALKKNSGYLVVLYGDELPSTPGPVPPGYPQPGNNPFATPVPPGYPQPGQPGQPGYPPGYPTPNPYGTPNPYATQTPFGAYPSPTNRPF